MVGLVWANLFYIDLNPAQGSFLPRWLGTRLFLTEGSSPYSTETTTAIRRSQQAGGLEPGPADSFYLYPFFSFVFYTPFALTANMTTARVAWMTILELALLGVLAISLNLSRWRVPSWAVILLVIFSVTWYYGVQPVLDGDLSVLVALMLVISLAAIRVEQDVLAGFLLALSLVKPTSVLPLIIFVLIWAASLQRWTMVGTFFGSLFLMVAAASLLIPDWVIQNIRQIIEYARLPLTNTPGTLISFWLPGIGRQTGWLLTIATIILLAWEWYQAFRKEFRWFFWTACLTLALTPLVGMPTSLNNFIVIFPGLILVLAVWEERWGKVGKFLWLVSLVLLSVGVWWLVLNPSQNGMPPDQNPWLFLFLPFFMLIGAYWVRWWAIQPARLPLDEMV
jgi:hypothetical protein